MSLSLLSCLRGRSSLFVVGLRYKGHSKWANIRHTKGEKDAARARLIVLHTARIRGAVKEGKGETDPKFNVGLARAVETAIAMGVPKSTVEGVLAKAKDKIEDLNEIVFEIYGPGRAALIALALCKHRQHGLTNFTAAWKKNGGEVQRPGTFKGLFSQRGVIVVSGIKGGLDEAENIAIEVGAEEVEEVEGEGGIFEFLCEPIQVVAVKKALEKEENVKIETAEVVFIPNTTVELDERDLGHNVKIIENLKNNASVISVHHNISNL